MPQNNNTNADGSKQLLLSHIRNIVLQGAGISANVYLGFTALERIFGSAQQDYNSTPLIELSSILRFCGVSSGAVISTLLSIGYSLEALRNVFFDSEAKQDENLFVRLMDDGDTVANLTFKTTLLKSLELLNSNQLSIDDYFSYIISSYLRHKANTFIENHSVNRLSDIVISPLIMAVKVFFSLFGGISIAFLDSVIKRKLETFGFRRHAEIEVIIKDLLGLNISLSNYIQCLFAMFDKFSTKDANHPFGLFSGERLLNWLKMMIREAGFNENITFGELKYQQLIHNRPVKDLYVLVTNLTTGFTEIYSYEHPQHSKAIIADTVRAAVSICFFFQQHEIRYKNSSDQIVNSPDIVTDAGVVNNYPINVFDSLRYLIPDVDNKSKLLGKLTVYNYQTLGIRIVTPELKSIYEENNLRIEKKDDSIINGFDIPQKLLKTILGKQESDHYLSCDDLRTIYIDKGSLSTLTFVVNNSQKERLLANSNSAVDKYVERFFNLGIAELVNFLKEKLFNLDIPTNLNTIEKTHTSRDLSISEKNQYYCQVFDGTRVANDEHLLFKILDVYPEAAIYKVDFETMKRKFNNPNVLKTLIFFFKYAEETIGFSLFEIHSIYYPSREDIFNNHFLLINRSTVIRPSHRNNGVRYYMYHSLYGLINYLHIQYPDANIIQCGRIFNPKIFSLTHQLNDLVFPNLQSTPNLIYDFMIYLRNYFGYHPVGDDPFLVESYGHLSQSDMKDIKIKKHKDVYINYFFEKTKLQNCAFFTIVILNLAENNVLGITAKKQWDYEKYRQSLTKSAYSTNMNLFFENHKSGKLEMKDVGDIIPSMFSSPKSRL